VSFTFYITKCLSWVRIQLERNLDDQLNALISASHALNVRTAAVFDPTLQLAAFLIVRWLLPYGPETATILAESTAIEVLSDTSEFTARGSSMIYGKTKLLDIMFTQELGRQLDGTGVTVNA